MRQLHQSYLNSGSSGPTAEIIIVYQKEPHAGQLAFREIAQPETFEQRCKLAKRMQDEYELPMTVLVDSMEDQSRALFSDLPSPAFVIDAAGVIRAKFPWADTATIGPAVAALTTSVMPPMNSMKEMDEMDEMKKMVAMGEAKETVPKTEKLGTIERANSVIWMLLLVPGCLLVIFLWSKLRTTNA